MKRNLLIILVVFSLTCMSACTRTHTSSSLDDYLVPDVPMSYTEFLIFPEKDSLKLCSAVQYQSKSVSTLLFDDIYLRLSCTYTSQQYEQEIIRLERSSAEYRTDLFMYPSYVMLFYSHYFEYALLDASSNTIIYVAAQASDFQSAPSSKLLEGFPVQYLPFNSQLAEICKYEYA